MFKKVLVANRGEIAVRVLRGCGASGIETVGIYSDADRGAMHVRHADTVYAIGGRTSSESYLDIEKITDVIRRSGADAVHPGYGFLSENASFARAVAEAGATFIGPPPAAIDVMGDKVRARRAAEAAGVPVVPGRSDVLRDPEEIVDFGLAVGWPVAVKAVFGGGGRGLKVVRGPQEARDAMVSAEREAASSFGRSELYVEKYLDWPRHVEMQIARDDFGNGVWLGDRDCSIQRRHQKLIEEAPATFLTDDLRTAMGAAALRMAQGCDYRNLGTLEFLVQDGAFYFLEMNTRLQVEHPVTELTTSLDLVQLQLRIAAGEALNLDQEDVRPRGHAIEVRINAEDPAAGAFVPSPGLIDTLKQPAGPWVRWDSGYEAGDTVSEYYDSLVAKLVIHAPSRPEALRRVLAALDEVEIVGVETNVSAHRAVVTHHDFIEDSHSTRWLEEKVASGGLTFDLPRSKPSVLDLGDPGGMPGSVPRSFTAELDGRRYELRLWGDGLRESSPHPAQATSTKRSRRTRDPAVADSGTVVSTMQGTIDNVRVVPGDEVTAGQLLCVLEAMKMENNVCATRSGTVVEVLVAPGASVGASEVLFRIE